MSQNRKLQTEIDRVFKKIAEGVDNFEDIWNKLYSTDNLNQKEKFEADLKKEIKKLQRHRDQIKTWVSSSEIKDKKPLMEQRKLIESKMERFKECEKEMKTKAYSKEGLASTKMDPREKAKLETRKWIVELLDVLNTQIDTYEAELEVLQSKKRSGQVAERMDKLEKYMERHKHHMARLELILRLIENDSLETDQVNPLKEDLTYYAESHQEEDFIEDEGLYDELNLQDEDLLESESDSDEDEDEKPVAVSKKVEKSSEAVSAPTASISTKVKEDGFPPPDSKFKTTKEEPKPVPKPVLPAYVPPTTATTAAPTAQHTPSIAPSTATPAASAAAIAAAAAAAAAAAKKPPAKTTTPGALPGATGPPATSLGASTTKGVVPQERKPEAAPSLAKPSTTAPSIPPTSVPTAGPLPIPSARPSAPSSTTAPIRAAPPSVPIATSAAPSSSTPSTASSAAPSIPSSAVTSAISTSTSAVPSTSASGPLPSVGTATGSTSQTNPPSATSPPSATAPSSQGAVTDQSKGTTQGISSILPGLSSVLVPSTPTIQQDATIREDDRDFILDAFSGSKIPSALADLIPSEASKNKPIDESLQQLLLQSSLANMPDVADSERLKHYVPKVPQMVPPYYPQAPAPSFDHPSVFEKFDTDTLFFIFYFQQGTYQQYLAARELKKQSWRFHKKYLTWFQRHEEPKSITEEFEQGTYVYFDYETSWCQRKKSEFTFEYRFLEDESFV